MEKQVKKLKIGKKKVHIDLRVRFSVKLLKMYWLEKKPV